jgi:hypothetical protein
MCWVFAGHLNCIKQKTVSTGILRVKTPCDLETAIPTKCGVAREAKALHESVSMFA